MDIPLLQSQADSVSALENAIREIKEGEVETVIIFSIRADGRYRISSPSCQDRHQLGGLLVEAGTRRLLGLLDDER